MPYTYPRCSEIDATILIILSSSVTGRRFSGFTSSPEAEGMSVCHSKLDYANWNAQKRRKHTKTTMNRQTLSILAIRDASFQIKVTYGSNGGYWTVAMPAWAARMTTISPNSNKSPTVKRFRSGELFPVKRIDQFSLCSTFPNPHRETRGQSPLTRFACMNGSWRTQPKCGKDG